MKIFQAFLLFSLLPSYAGATDGEEVFLCIFKPVGEF